MENSVLPASTQEELATLSCKTLWSNEFWSQRTWLTLSIRSIT